MIDSNLLHPVPRVKRSAVTIQGESVRLSGPSVALCEAAV
jgi:hypothetical protein